MTSRISPFHLLSGMPPVFDLRELEILSGTSHEYAITLAYRWRRAGYIEMFAEEVYFNLVRDPQAREHHLPLAVEKALPLPHLKIGMSALHEAGWTTQIDKKPELAVLTTRTVRGWKKLNHVTVEGRGSRWFDVAWRNSYEGTGGFRYLNPAYALVDCIMARERFLALPPERRKKAWDQNAVIWHPDPDDVDIQDPADAVQSLAMATEELNADPEVVVAYLSEVDGLEDMLDEFNETFADRSHGM